uniref:Uncharacterized protein n=1 Tax=Cajanus cajan TaxID=3821 RepID=A0A151T7P7_CAJCA|nr:hypothetical protein KK1_017653 [Cajanus cajan]
MALYTRRLLTTLAPTRSSPSNQIKTLLSNGLYHQTLQLFTELHLSGQYSISFVLPSVIKASSSAQCHAFGTQLHCIALKTGSHSESVVSNSIITMYAKFSDVESARKVFDTTLHRDPITWNSMINGYLQNGCDDSLMALRVFDELEVKNEVSWTAMISGCIANQDYDEAFACFRAMQAEGVCPNRVTSIALLPACTEPGSVKYGKEIHSYAFRHGFESCPSFSSALINMYGQHGESMQLAELIFEGSRFRDVVLWSSIIGSYSRRGDSNKTFKLFNKMRTAETEPNYVTLLAVISACTNLSSLKQGCGLHGYIFKSGFSFSISVGNALINMYAKCGCLDGSSKIFLEMTNKDSVTWSSLINAYGLHGCGEQALQLFYEMNERRVKSDAITFLAVLSACNHAGLVSEGQRIFKQVNVDYKIPLTIEHYACLVDLLGRSGKLEDALEILRTMPMKPSARIWSSLVSACKLHGRLDIAEMLAPQLIRSEPNNAGNYTLLNMIYGEHGHWLDTEQVREEMTRKRLKKCYGFSRIEAGDENF